MTGIERKSLAERLKNLRKEHGLSTSELARRAGLSKGYLSQLERDGTHNPSVEALGRVAGALGLSLSEMVGEPRTESPGKGDLPPGLREFLEASARSGVYVRAEDVTMLTGIRYRGRQPHTEADWAYLYETIKRVVS